jgi:isocitrate dehydrogenase (NAD+)
MTMRRISVIRGDGIGPEVVDEAIRVVKAAGVSVAWEYVFAGDVATEVMGDALPADTLASITRNKVALKGPTNTPIGEGRDSINVGLRQKFNLYANVRPVHSWQGVKTRYENVDLVIFRENVEDVYVGKGRFLDPEKRVAESTGIITYAGSERLVRYAFEYALKNGRRKVTLVHKANILKETQGLFKRAGEDVARQYPTIQFETAIVDAFSMRAVMNPSQFDCVVTTNMFGDIISDMCAGLVGGLGLAPGANIGEGCAIFEAVHGSAPDIAGQGKANPTALILSAVMMLEYLGEIDAAARIRSAVTETLAAGLQTGDLRPVVPALSTTEFTDAVIMRLSR